MADKPRKLRTAQSQFTMLIGNLRAGSDPSRGTAGNPETIRPVYTQQHFPEIAGRGQTWGEDATPPKTPGVGTRHGALLTNTYTAASATVTVADNDFSTGSASLFLGGYEMISDVHYTVGGTPGDTATNLAAAIDALSEYSASAVGSDITITGPFGPNVNEWRFEDLYKGTVVNFTLSVTTGSLDGGDPTLGPPELS